jgi:glycolate oxidase FAD binding subunit
VSPPPETAGPDGFAASATTTATETIRPETVDRLREEVGRLAAAGVAIYPRGGGTAMDYGHPPTRPGATIETTALDRVIDYPAADMTITVEAGMTLAALQAHLARENQRLTLEAPFPERATLGGIFATNTCGPRRFGLGRPRDQVLGVSFATSDGNVVKGGGRVVKNVAGYDFPRLLTGSMGTLGILTQMTLKTRPRPEASALVWLTPPAGAGDLGAALERLNTSATRPVAIELLNGAAAAALAATLGTPTADHMLIVGFEDNAASVAWQVDALRGEFPGWGMAARRDAEAGPAWDALTASAAAAPGPFSIVANLRPSAAWPFVLALEPGRWAAQAHAGNGIVRAHALGDWTPEAAAAAVATLRARAVASGGNLVVPRAPDAWKPALAVWGEPRGDWPLMARIKAALDPRGVMNPGRFVGTI